MIFCGFFYYCECYPTKFKEKKKLYLFEPFLRRDQHKSPGTNFILIAVNLLKRWVYVRHAKSNNSHRADCNLPDLWLHFILTHNLAHKNRQFCLMYVTIGRLIKESKCSIFLSVRNRVTCKMTFLILPSPRPSMNRLFVVHNSRCNEF